MAPSRTADGGIGRVLAIGLAALLLTGIVGSLFMGIRAKNRALSNTATQASDVASSSLTLVFKPDDLDGIAEDARAASLTDQIETVVFDPSEFDGVTLWSPEGTILYSTDEGRIGNQLDGERTRIREALRGKPQSVVANGEISVMVPLEFASGVGEPAVVELTRTDEPVAVATASWRTSTIFIAVTLIVVIGLLLWNRYAPAATEPHPVMRRAEERSHVASGGGAQAPAPAAGPRTISVSQPGMREEADARRMAEDRARAAEERLGVLQEQYRNTLEELQVLHRQVQQNAGRPDPQLEERAMLAESRARQLEDHARIAEERARAMEERAQELEDRAGLFERQAASTQAELEEMGRRTAERALEDDERDGDGRTHQAEQEVIGLRAELEGVQTQLSMARRELDTMRTQAERARELKGDLDSVNMEALRVRQTAENAQAELQVRAKELDDLRSELRALRAEEQRAAMLEDELRAAKAELQSVGASQRAELIEREAELEEKVRAMREEFQGELSRMESQYREQMAQRELELSQRVSGAEDAAAQRLDAAEREIAERAERFEHAEDDIAKATAEAQHLASELTIAQAELETTVAQLQSESERARMAEERLARVEGSSNQSSAAAQRFAAELEAAAQENADLNRRLQEIEARRALEIADAEGRADLDDILRVTQERLAGQTEKLIAAEERAQKVEKALHASSERLEEVESELRQQQMAQAMREIRGEGQPDDEVAAPVAAATPLDPDDRRAASPFLKELSMDAKKSLTRILGITQILKHKKDAKDQAQLVRQLAAHTRRLDHIVADLSDADRIAHGTVELTVRRTDLEPLIQRVVEESGLDADHELRINAERLVVAVDPQRTEQIVSGMLRISGDRTPPKKAITVRLLPSEGGALIVVEDPEPSSDASISPVVQRFAEVQGGWAKVESQESGGSAFSVFLPDGAGLGGPQAGTADATREVKVVVDDPGERWEPHDEKALVDELHRLSNAED